MKNIMSALITGIVISSFVFALSLFSASTLTPAWAGDMQEEETTDETQDETKDETKEDGTTPGGASLN